MNFVVADGQVVSSEDLNITPFAGNSSFQITHGLWFGFGGIPLLQENTESLIRQMEVLALTVPDILKNHRELFRIIKRMLNKNRFYRSGHLYFRIFWNEDAAHTVITAKPFSTFEFPFQEKGVLLEYSGQKKYSENILNRFSFYNRVMWKADSQSIKNTETDNLLMLNEKGIVCDCIEANIFMIREGTLLTPSLTCGCYEDTLRPVILKLAERTGLKTTESEKISTRELLQSDEIFIAGEVSGIRWVLGIENKRFLHHHSVNIHKELNKFLKGKVR